MSNFYGIYKQSRDASWKFLIDNQICSLPLDFNPILTKMNLHLKADKQGLLSPHEKGATILTEDVGYIILRPNASKAEKRYTVAHEIGHIVLGHINSGKHFIGTSEQEYQAERFAIGILAPACVLWGLDLHTPEEIASFCDISLASAKIRAERMKTLYARNAFLLSPLERQVFQQFKPYIDSLK